MPVQEIIHSIETLVTSKIAVAAISLLWVVVEIRNQREDRKQHYQERKEWAERIERLTESLNRTLQSLEISINSYSNDYRNNDHRNKDNRRNGENE